MTTSEPSLAQRRSITPPRAKERLLSRRSRLRRRCRAPKNAALSIMIGGEKDVVAAVQPLFECMGKTIVHQGPAGAGQHTKVVNQILIASNMVGVCEALLYGFKSGLESRNRFQIGLRRRAGSKSRWRCSARPRSWPATSNRAFSSSTSSRTWESRSTNRRRCRHRNAGPGTGASALPGGCKGLGLWPQGDAGVDDGAGDHFRDQEVASKPQDKRSVPGG